MTRASPQQRTAALAMPPRRTPSAFARSLAWRPCPRGWRSDRTSPRRRGRRPLAFQVDTPITRASGHFQSARHRGAGAERHARGVLYWGALRGLLNPVNYTSRRFRQARPVTASVSHPLDARFRHARSLDEAMTDGEDPKTKRFCEDAQRYC